MSVSEPEVYVIDDDASARESVVQLVRTWPMRVREFASADSFLLSYGGHRPACVVTDLRLPGMSGIDLVVDLQRRGLTVPVIVLTAHAETRTIVQAMKAGAYTTLDKPYRETELLDTIRAAVQEDRHRSEADQRNAELRKRFAALTRQERQIVHLLVEGEQNKQIANVLQVGLRTIEARKQTIHEKLGTESLADLIKVTLVVEPEHLNQIPAPHQGIKAAHQPRKRGG